MINTVSGSQRVNSSGGLSPSFADTTALRGARGRTEGEVRHDDDHGDAKNDGHVRPRAIATRVDGYTDERATIEWVKTDGKRSSHVEPD